MISKKIKGVFFDAGNTLLKVHPSVGAIYSDTARKFGVDMSSEAIEESFKNLWDRTAPLVSNEGHRLSYEKEKDWWRFLVREVFIEHFESGGFEIFFNHLYNRFAEPDCWRLYDDVLEVLNVLQNKGYKLAIVSNWDSRLPVLCEMLGIQSYFESVIVSALVGYEKPHPTIFEIALSETNLLAEEVIYVGDDPFLDYEAARKIGIEALHLDRQNRFPVHPHRINSLREMINSLL